VLGSLTKTTTHWSDSFDDDGGLAWLENTAVVNGNLELSQVEPLALVPSQEEVLTITGGPGGKIYLGTSGARLRVYDPATKNLDDLGEPVPDECDQ
jgi:hypothetical protein